MIGGLLQLLQFSSRLKSLAKEGGWVVGGQVVAVLGSLVIVRVLTEHLRPEQYGELALGMTVAGFVNQAVMGGIVAGVARFYSIAVEKQELFGYLRASYHLLLYATLVVIAIGIMLIIALLMLGYYQWISLVAVVLVFSLLNSYNASLNGIQNAARQRSIVAFHGGLDAWMKIVLALIMIYWLGASSTAIVTGYVSSSLIIIVSQFYFLRKNIVHRVNRIDDKGRHWKKEMWAYSRPFSTWGVFTWVYMASDRWALEYFSNTHDVGLYAVLYQLGYYPIGLVTNMIVSFIGPILYQRSGDAADSSRNDNVHKLAWNITFVCMGITIFSFCLVLFLHGWIFSVLVARQYHTVSGLLPWVILSGGLFATGQILSLKLMSEMRSRSMVRVKIGTALLGVVLNIIGASVMGLIGIVIASVIFSGIYLIWMVKLSYRLNSANTL